MILDFKDPFFILESAFKGLPKCPYPFIFNLAALSKMYFKSKLMMLYPIKKSGS